MNVLLDKFLNPDVIDDCYAYDTEGQYSSLNLCDFENVFDQIKALPAEDSPSIFGFHPTALNTLHLNKSEQMMNWILGVQPRLSGGDAAAKDDEIVLSLAEDLDQQLISEISLKGANQELLEEKGDKPNSLTVVLFQEIERYNKLIKVIHSTLRNCCSAIRGEVVMSIDASEVYHALLSQKVPRAWSDVAYPSMKPLNSWFKDLLARVEFIKEWLRKGEPTCFWFPGFFFPQSFLTAVLQSHSRKHSLPIDRLSFEAHVVKQPPEQIIHPPEDGAYIYGLFIDGAKWSQENWCVMDNDTDVVYNNFPVVHILPRVDFTPPKEDYFCPLYRTAERAGVLSTTGHSTNFVVALNLPTNSNPDKWTLRGTALLLTTPY